MARIVRCSHKACGLVADLSTWIFASEPGSRLNAEYQHCPRCWCKTWYPAKEGEKEKPKRGDELIALERIRQQRVLGYGPERDAEHHARGELAGMAVCYALNACGFENPHCIELQMPRVSAKVRVWPIHEDHWKPEGKISDLVRAGALIAAEIDRLQRVEAGRESGAP